MKKVLAMVLAILLTIGSSLCYPEEVLAQQTQEQRTEQIDYSAASLETPGASRRSIDLAVTSSGGIHVVGAEILLTARAEVTQGATYKFVYRYGDNWDDWGVVRDFASSPSASFVPQKSGKYVMYVDVKDQYETIETKTTECFVNERWVHTGVTISPDGTKFVGEPISIKGSALENISGGAQGLSYKFVYRYGDNWDNWGVIKEFSNSTTVSWTPEKEGDYTLYVDIKDQSGRIETKTSPCTISSKWNYKGVSTDKSSPQRIGSQIKISANISDIQGAASYKFVYRYGDNWDDWGIIRDFSSTNSAVWAPQKEGKYTLYVDVKDTAGKMQTDTIEYQIQKDWQYNGITADKPSPQKPGTGIRIGTDISDTNDQFTYKFVYRYGENWDDWGIIQDFSKTNTAVWMPLKDGSYTVYVDVKDESGMIRTKTIEYKIYREMNFKGIKPDKISPQTAGTTVAISADIDAAFGNLEYKFVYRYGEDWDDWGVIKEFSKTNSASWTPTKAGHYTLYADVKEEAGTITTKTMSYTIQGEWELLGVKPSKASPQNPGTSISLSAGVKNPVDSLQYKFVYRYGDNWNNWGVIRDFSKTNSAIWTPSKSGSYTIYVDVKDAKGRIATKTLVYVVSSSSSPAAASISISNTSGTVPAGKSFYVKAVVTPSSERAYFTSSDGSIATVSERGFVYGVSPGTAVITAMDKTGKIKKTCTVQVTESNPVKFAYSSPNNAPRGSLVKLIAITNQDQDAVKFSVGEKEIAAAKSTDENTFVWTASILASEVGTSQVKTYAKRNGSWSTCSDGNFSIYVSGSTDTTTAVLENRRISDQGVDFIAQSEGFIGTVYDDPLVTDTPTLGYGKVIWAGETFYNDITRQEGFAMLLKSLNDGAYTSSVNRFLLNNSVKYNQRQFDALVSFSYNVGTAWTGNGYDLNRIILNAYESGDSSMTGVVAVDDSLNLRSGPGTSYRVIGSLYDGNIVTILESVNGWYKVKTAGGVTGYCSAEFIKISASGAGSRNLNNVNWNEFSLELNSWHHAGGCVLGLLYRRLDELSVFFYGEYQRHWTNGYNPHAFPIPNCIKGQWKG